MNGEIVAIGLLAVTIFLGVVGVAACMLSSKISQGELDERDDPRRRLS